MSATLRSGLVALSTHTILVAELVASATSSGSSMGAAFQLSPQRSATRANS